MWQTSIVRNGEVIMGDTCHDFETAILYPDMVAHLMEPGDSIQIAHYIEGSLQSHQVHSWDDHPMHRDLCFQETVAVSNSHHWQMEGF